MQKYWGKAEKNNEIFEYLTVWEHSLNVAAVAQIWLQKRPLLLYRWAELLAKNNNLPLSNEDTLQLAIHFILLHDLGKYDPRFQGKVPELCATLSGHKLKGSSQSYDHGSWGFFYYSWVKSNHQKIIPKKIQFHQLIRATTSHHGSWCPMKTEDKAIAVKRVIQDYSDLFLQAIAQHIETVEKLYPLPEISTKIRFDAVTISFLAGLCTVVDWLGSNKDFFPYQSLGNSDNQPDDITDVKRKKAFEILNENHLLGKYCGDPSKRIERILGEKEYIPYPLQQEALNLPLSKKSQLIIIEAPMGEGKTEAAMFITDRLLEMGCVDNFYFALPTMATSNAMYERMSNMLAENRFFDENSSLVLATSKRDLNDPFSKSIIQNTAEGDQGKENPSALKMCNEFFASSRKRSLLATAGVGTVDQAMSSVLRMNHHWVKLFGLSNGVLIIDEVHAYDSYMLEIIEKLIAYLKHLGTHIILLSATLPLHTKNKLIAAFEEKKSSDWDEPNTFQPHEQKKYPLITHVTSTQDGLNQNWIPFKSNREWEISPKIKWLTDEEQIIDNLITLAQGGAQACFIVNSVAKAQAFYEQIKSALTMDDQIEVSLFHSRFMMIDRNKIEKQVKENFGKDGFEKRKLKGRILIATQVIEQSLDVDFDLMFSELAPIDLLLQRLGRLHRHPQNNKLRQGHAWEKPNLFVYCPCETISEILNDQFRSVYASYLLYRTALLIHRRNNNFSVNIPDDIRPLVEEVYSCKELQILKDDTKPYEEAKRQWENQESAKEQNGAGVPQPSPTGPAKRLDTGRSFETESHELEENFTIGGTRLISESIQIYFVEIQWTLGLVSSNKSDKQYIEFKSKLENHSLSMLTTMLRKKDGQCVQSIDFDPYQNWPDPGSWSAILKRFKKEFPYEPSPLILPLPQNDNMEAEYHFKNTKFYLKYTKTLGLQKVDTTSG